MYIIITQDFLISTKNHYLPKIQNCCGSAKKGLLTLILQNKPLKSHVCVSQESNHRQLQMLSLMIILHTLLNFSCDDVVNDWSCNSLLELVFEDDEPQETET